MGRNGLAPGQRPPCPFLQNPFPIYRVAVGHPWRGEPSRTINWTIIAYGCHIQSVSCWKSSIYRGRENGHRPHRALSPVVSASCLSLHFSPAALRQHPKLGTGAFRRMPTHHQNRSTLRKKARSEFKLRAGECNSLSAWPGPPKGLRPQYHQRRQGGPPCSEWERVEPCRATHRQKEVVQGVQPFTTSEEVCLTD